MFWERDCREDAERFIRIWLKEVHSVGNSRLDSMANMIENHLDGILNYYDYPITTASLEGINNKIMVLRRAACGFCDMGYFKLRILFIREASFALAGA